jgi:alpha-D-xyloside xylohydrolase
VRNAYPLYVTQAVYQGQRAGSESKRVCILTRSAFAGQQRNAAACWSGDISGNWKTLRCQIPAGLNFCMAGIPYWTTDIGGFFRPQDQYKSAAYHELLIRWFEYGAFCPIFRIHGYKTETEMWKFGPEVEKVLRKYDELRYRLMPYLYSTAWKVTQEGYSVMRALPLDFRTDPAVQEIADQFMFGPSLLVNPVTEAGATARSLYLPKGTNWVDFWTGRRLEGGKMIQAAAPLDTLPLYVEAGSIIPLGPFEQYAAAKSDPVELRVYPGHDASFVLYEDENDNYNYEKGDCATIPIRWDEKNRELTIGPRQGSFPGMLKKRTFLVVWVREGHGTGLAVTGKPDAEVRFNGAAVKIPPPQHVAGGLGQRLISLSRSAQ